MKLVELLVKEIKEWPEDVTYFVQDCDREVKAGIGFELSKPTDSGVWIRHITLDNYNFYSDLCTDWQTSVVTKDIFTEHKEEIQFPLPTKGHIHAELIVQYGEDAKTTDKPWKLWEYNTPNFRGYKTCFEPIAFLACNKYRRKPKTKLIHGVEIPVFDFTPKVGEKYYAANVGLPELFEDGYMSSEDCTFTQRMIERGLLYPCTEEGKQATILHSKAMLSIA